jgi:PHD finger-like domain-containing protein 5A
VRLIFIQLMLFCFHISTFFLCYHFHHQHRLTCTMSRHQFDLVVCMRLPGQKVGLLCPKCDGRCPTCDSFVNSQRKVHICDDCSFGTMGECCIICGNGAKPGEMMHEAYYCSECCLLERDRDGCPKVTNVGGLKSDNFYQKKKKTIGKP